MQKKGISRRIDELGRIVIPKEIRKNLKIRESDEIDIIQEGENIILNKHIISKDKILDEFIKILRKYLKKNVLYTSKDKILSSYYINKKKKVFLNDDIIDLILNRKIYDNHNSNIDNLDNYYVINPIVISNGDLLGSIICYSEEVINDQEKELLDFTKIFFENYLEYE